MKFSPLFMLLASAVFAGFAIFNILDLVLHNTGEDQKQKMIYCAFYGAVAIATGLGAIITAIYECATKK